LPQIIIGSRKIINLFSSVTTGKSLN